nr:MAG TPA: hypothetical protein [Caudoviricetes sp.]
MTFFMFCIAYAADIRRMGSMTARAILLVCFS